MICNCCGEAGHKKPDCDRRMESCTLCGKVGHLPATCSKRNKQAAAAPQAAAAAPQLVPCWFCPDTACVSPQFDENSNYYSGLRSRVTPGRAQL